MGRRKKAPMQNGDVDAVSAAGEGAGKKQISDAALKRLGFGKMICQRCNCRNHSDAERCHKCGNNELREKKLAYADE